MDLGLSNGSMESVTKANTETAQKPAKEFSSSSTQATTKASSWTTKSTEKVILILFRNLRMV